MYIFIYCIHKLPNRVDPLFVPKMKNLNIKNINGEAEILEHG